MRTGNPVLNDNTFQTETLAGNDVMTIQGTVYKTAFSLLVLVATASIMWGQMVADKLSILVVCAIAAFIVALVTVFKKAWSPVTTPLYAALEGFVLGGFSALYEVRFPGIVIHAIALTFGTLFALLFAYQSRLIRATENFKLGVFAATGGICLLYLVDIVLRMFGHPIAFIHEGTWLGIAFSLFVVVIAALNLVLDFDFIEQGAEKGAPKYMEWYGAFGLMVTLIWLYMEILRLLAKTRSRQ